MTARFLAAGLGAVVLAAGLGCRAKPAPPAPAPTAAASLPPAEPATSPGKAAPDPLPAGAGKDLVANACTQCHTLDRIVARHMDKAGWQGTVDDMVSRGLDLSDADETTIVAYLAAHFGKKGN